MTVAGLPPWGPRPHPPRAGSFPESRTLTPAVSSRQPFPPPAPIPKPFPPLCGDHLDRLTILAYRISHVKSKMRDRGKGTYSQGSEARRWGLGHAFRRKAVRYLRNDTFRRSLPPGPKTGSGLKVGSWLGIRVLSLFFGWVPVCAQCAQGGY